MNQISETQIINRALHSTSKKTMEGNMAQAVIDGWAARNLMESVYLLSQDENLIFATKINEILEKQRKLVYDMGVLLIKMGNDDKN